MPALLGHQEIIRIWIDWHRGSRHSSRHQDSGISCISVLLSPMLSPFPSFSGKDGSRSSNLMWSSAGDRALLNSKSLWSLLGGGCHTSICGVITVFWEMCLDWIGQERYPPACLEEKESLPWKHMGWWRDRNLMEVQCTSSWGHRDDDIDDDDDDDDFKNVSAYLLLNYK